MLGIGYWAMRKTKSVGDFFLGGRSIGPWMSAFAYGTTYFSAVLFIGYAGRLGWASAFTRCGSPWQRAHRYTGGVVDTGWSHSHYDRAGWAP